MKNCLKIKVLFWVPYPSEGASNRYRVEQFLPYLEEENILYSLHSFWSSVAYKKLYKKGYYLRKICFFILGTLSRIMDLIQVFRYDIVFIHREAYPLGDAFFESILFFLRKPIIFDFDDAIFLPFSSNPNNFIECFKHPAKTGKIIKMCREIIAGNEYLANFVLNYNSSVSIIPTSIDTDKYYANQKEDSDIVVIGWMGSITTSVFLEDMENVFSRILNEFDNVRLKIIGGSYSFDGKNILNKAWALNEEIEDLRTFDIGIMPMPDNEWNKGKCGFKAILYMSMGIPCVSSPVGINKDIISDAINGYLANTEDEWVERLSLLIKNPELRKRMGRAARSTIEEKYSVKVNAPRFLEVVRKACNNK